MALIGAFGPLLSVPLTMVAKIIREQNDKTLPFAIVLRSDKDPEALSETTAVSTREDDITPA